MSVRPIAFNNPDGTHTVVCDETGHQGTVAPTSITFGPNVDGTPNLRVLSVPCPDGCGVTSSHPISDGAASAAIQELFARTLARAGCPCGVVKPNTSLLVAVSHARLEVQRIRPTGWTAGAIH